MGTLYSSRLDAFSVTATRCSTRSGCVDPSRCSSTSRRSPGLWRRGANAATQWLRTRGSTRECGAPETHEAIRSVEVDAVPAACRGEGCGVERAVASGGFLATGVTRCCCDADCLGPFSLSFSFSLASFGLDEEPPILSLVVLAVWDKFACYSICGKARNG